MSQLQYSEVGLNRNVMVVAGKSSAGLECGVVPTIVLGEATEDIDADGCTGFCAEYNLGVVELFRSFGGAAHGDILDMSVRISVGWKELTILRQFSVLSSIWAILFLISMPCNSV